mmetsp:Transcript_53364/g.116991  ORF Transcript_53364/g.116991 Transcript_53364/m.116991 type:complete len:214 (-) Transcript_53364:135-776(-)
MTWACNNVAIMAWRCGMTDMRLQSRGGMEPSRISGTTARRAASRAPGPAPWAAAKASQSSCACAWSTLSSEIWLLSCRLRASRRSRREAKPAHAASASSAPEASMGASSPLERASLSSRFLAANAAQRWLMAIRCSAACLCCAAASTKRCWSQATVRRPSAAMRVSSSALRRSNTSMRPCTSAKCAAWVLSRSWAAQRSLSSAVRASRRALSS